VKSLTPNDLGKTFLVEDCERVAISDFFKLYKEKLKIMLMHMELDMLGIVNVRITSSKIKSGGTRYWFVCPFCSKRAGVLFRHPIENRVGCRKCLKLEYRKRRYRGMIEADFN
jgi:hypothetical protein